MILTKWAVALLKQHIQLGLDNDIYIYIDEVLIKVAQIVTCWTMDDGTREGCNPIPKIQMEKLSNVQLLEYT